MYTAISNTPTCLTLFTKQTSATPQPNMATSPQQQQVKVKGRRSSRVQKRKLPDQRNTKRKARKKEKSETCEAITLLMKKSKKINMMENLKICVLILRNNMRIVSWLLSLPEGVISMCSKLSIAPWIINEGKMLGETILLISGLQIAKVYI